MGGKIREHKIGDRIGERRWEEYPCTSNHHIRPTKTPFSMRNSHQHCVPLVMCVYIHASFGQTSERTLCAKRILAVCNTRRRPPREVARINVFHEGPCQKQKYPLTFTSNRAGNRYS